MFMFNPNNSLVLKSYPTGLANTFNTTLDLQDPQDSKIPREKEIKGRRRSSLVKETQANWNVIIVELLGIMPTNVRTSLTRKHKQTLKQKMMKGSAMLHRLMRAHF